jgi:two-component system, chemotaxis family, protein-glutamate methylesterase/glutaminase
MIQDARIRVLIVDDSAIVRKVLSDVLSNQPDIDVVGTAPDPYVARDKIVSLRPDVLTLDIEMPRMDGLTFLDRLMAFHPMPVVVISSLTRSSTRSALEAVNRGAVDVMAKPGGPYSVGDLKDELPRRVRAAAVARVRLGGSASPLAGVTASRGAMQVGTRLAQSPELDLKPAIVAAPPAGGTWIRDRFVAIGASTGGTQAIEQILRQFPADFPPVLATQHIPVGFSAAFAERLNGCCAMRVDEAKDGDILRSGHAYIAPGSRHMQVIKSAAGGYAVRLHDGPKMHYQRPAVDELFFSAARLAQGAAMGILLTGMGKDGAEGLLAMRNAGCHTVVQDEATCVVFGMPREAIELGAAIEVRPLQEIATAAMAAMRAPTSHAA